MSWGRVELVGAELFTFCPHSWGTCTSGLRTADTHRGCDQLGEGAPTRLLQRPRPAGASAPGGLRPPVLSDRVLSLHLTKCASVRRTRIWGAPEARQPRRGPVGSCGLKGGGVVWGWHALLRSLRRGGRRKSNGLTSVPPAPARPASSSREGGLVGGSLCLVLRNPGAAIPPRLAENKHHKRDTEEWHLGPPGLAGAWGAANPAGGEAGSGPDPGQSACCSAARLHGQPALRWWPLPGSGLFQRPPCRTASPVTHKHVGPRLAGRRQSAGLGQAQP